MKKKNKGFRNKDPRYFEKVGFLKKQLKRFFIKEVKRVHGCAINRKR